MKMYRDETTQRSSEDDFICRNIYQCWTFVFKPLSGHVSYQNNIT